MHVSEVFLLLWLLYFIAEGFQAGSVLQHSIRVSPKPRRCKSQCHIEMRKGSKRGSERSDSSKKISENEYEGSGMSGRGRSSFMTGQKTLGNLTGQSVQTWDFKQLKEIPQRKIVSASGGRGRGAKKDNFYNALSEYSAHFTELISFELQHEKDQVSERFYWSARDLMDSGYALLNLVAMPRGRLFREYVLRFSLPPKTSDRSSSNRGNSTTLKRPEMPFHRFSVGDVIAITAGNKPPNPILSPDDVGNSFIEGIILERTPFFLDIAVKLLPDGIAISRFRLDKIVSGVSYDRQFQALRFATDPDSPILCNMLRNIILIYSRESLDEIKRICNTKSGILPLNFQNAFEISRIGPELEQTMSKISKMAVETVQLGYNKGDIEIVLKDISVANALNDEQRTTIRQALCRRLTLIQGPPGTGKTYTACRIILAAVNLRKKSNKNYGKVLATAFSNIAADNLLEGCIQLGLKCVRIGRPATVRPELWESTMDAYMENHPEVIRAREKINVSDKFKSGKNGHSNREEREAAELRAVHDILKTADVVISSCTGATNSLLVKASEGNSDLKLGSLVFSTVIIDEATQATEPASLIPLLHGCKQLILVGDQNQLPPTILSHKGFLGGLGTSLFSRLIILGISPYLLTKQYRMHPKIAEFPSLQFYNGKLNSQVRPANRVLIQGFPFPNPKVPVLFLNVQDKNGKSLENREANGENGNYSLTNQQEAKWICLIMNRFAAIWGFKSIGIISPYSAQVKLISDLLKSKLRSVVKNDAELLHSAENSEQSNCLKSNPTDSRELIEVQSVDGFQGREKEIIVLSTVRNNSRGNVGFLADFRRLNVAITRARSGIIIIGHADTLRNDENWKAYIEWCELQNLIVSEHEFSLN